MKNRRDYTCTEELADRILRDTREDAEGCLLTKQNSGTMLIDGKQLQLQRLLAIWWGMRSDVNITSKCGKRNCVRRDHLREMIRKKSYYKPRPKKWSSMENKFFDCIVKENGCWVWTGAKTVSGYGMLAHDNQKIMAHRYSFWIHYKMLPDMVRHTCDNPPCVNPDHLLLGNAELNAMDREERKRGWHHQVRRGEKPARPRRCTSDVVCSACGNVTNKFNCVIKKNTSGLFYCNRRCRTIWQQKMGANNPAMNFTERGIASLRADYRPPKRNQFGVFEAGD